MAKQIAREKRPGHIDTEDHVTERVLEAAAWAENHRRAVIAGGIALVLVVAAAFYYQDYRSKLVDRASVRLQEIQMSAQSADMETIRSELRIFIDQYSSTPYASQARVALGDLELRNLTTELFSFFDVGQGAIKCALGRSQGLGGHQNPAFVKKFKYLIESFAFFSN